MQGPPLHNKKIGDWLRSKLKGHIRGGRAFRLEGYSEVVRTIADEYGNMSLIEFDGYFEGKLEPVKYTRVEVHTDEVDEEKIISFADRIRILCNITR